MVKVHKIKYLLKIIICLFAFSSYGQTAQKFKVALDAGHGAHDFGAVYNGHIEKNIALAVVLKVGKILEKNPNIEVIYTRKSDVFIELVERSNIANRADANIFVSIHCNANKNTAADGSETYVMGLNKNASNLAVAKSENAVITLEKDYKQKYEGFDPNNPGSMIGVTLMQEEYIENSIALASKIQDNFVNDNDRKSRGVKQAPFMVLHKAYMPRVLIEMGFISNPKEGAMLDSEDGQQETAEAIAGAIIGYKKEYFGNGNNEPNYEKPSKKVVEVKKDTALEKKVTTVKTPEVKKPEVKKPEPKENPASGVVFKVQIAAAGKKIDPVPSNFKGLKNISVTSDNGTLYKYMYGETSDYETAKRNLEEAKSKGYPSAYLIAFRDGKKITLQEAIK
ncbi:N-acetylmuramoyl-L-alanine amidase [Flavobacterium noncentrifugens]|uniref:N-acetylmuramoyl-L-alanine amidase n=1 Tax=Flavobacterium noncentrifugens TaxID=1128970 RepID=A0A1G8ZYU3_9FLAO|nr:N-acetylmuramoyl-L-alanine amidase [Flavobacterium noncentrifugens]GEP51802.1 N-acetylmuramoyl-L-alanine amidase [Flavobacterium noncentrifugens]SDK19505.1 N-acetylmuramoyl-L-alanine amidase [Flavobacterium noncentrifugens]